MCIRDRGQDTAVTKVYNSIVTKIVSEKEDNIGNEAIKKEDYLPNELNDNVGNK